MKEYVTIEDRAEAVITIKHSKFIATALYVADYDDALLKVTQLKKQYPDATHNCYALVADEAGMQCKFSDDGEPSGTAGTPILEVIKRKGITHVLVVVTRYFGGIKLGASGLVGAYSQAAAACLDVATKVRMIDSAVCTIGLDYALAGRVVNYVQKYMGVVLSTDYADGVVVTAALPDQEVEGLRAALIEYSKGTVAFEVLRHEYRGYV